MVYFTCNHCGESLKKPSVEKHYEQKCRGAPKYVSCMDCMKDFRGEEFKAHTKCISELERYSGKDYVAKDSKNSGQKKQEDWMDIVRSILDTKEYNLNPQIRGAFQKIQNLDNVPRKKVKFINFAANCLKMRKDLVEHVWIILEKELEKMKAAKAAEMEARKKQEAPKTEEKTAEKSSEKPKEPSIGDVTETMKVKKSKSKKRKVDKEIQNTIEQDEETDILKMVKQESDCSAEPSKKKSKKSSSKPVVEANAEQEPTISTTTPDDDFQWSLVIQCTVKKYGNNVKLDKVKRKVEKMYRNRRALPEFTEKQQAKFDKKFAKYLKKSNLKIEDNVVKME